MGWLLGFRATNIKVYSYEYATTATWLSNDGSVVGQSRTPPEGVIVPSVPYGTQPVTNDEIWRGFSIPKSTIDIKGPQYFMITLDDFFIKITDIYTVEDLKIIYYTLYLMQQNKADYMSYINGLNSILEPKYNIIKKWISDNIVF